MALLGKNGEVFRIGRAFVWSLTWGIGAAIGVALGGWLTLVGGAGAPGTEALDPGVDLFVLPLVALGGVVLVHLTGQVIAATARGRRAGKAGAQDDGDPEHRDDQVDG